MVERVVTLTVTRWVVVGGAAVTAVCVLLSVLLWNPTPLLGVPIGLLFAATPLLVRLDAVALDGPRLSVRRGFRWVGPVDLRNLVAFAYRPATHRRPAVWVLVQREAGARFGWLRRAGVDRELRDRLSGHRDLRVVDVAAGSRFSRVPGLAEHLTEYVLRSDALVESRARVALRAAAASADAVRSRESSRLPTPGGDRGDRRPR